MTLEQIDRRYPEIFQTREMADAISRSVGLAILQAEMTRADLAKRLGWSKDRLDSWLMGYRRDDQQIQEWRAIMAALGRELPA